MARDTSTELNKFKQSNRCGYSTNPIKLNPTQDDDFSRLEKPKESFEELCKMFNSLHLNSKNYEIKNDIVFCNSRPTSIQPKVFKKLSEEEKSIVAQNPNSDIAIALLQSVE